MKESFIKFVTQKNSLRPILVGVSPFTSPSFDDTFAFETRQLYDSRTTCLMLHYCLVVLCNGEERQQHKCSVYFSSSRNSVRGDSRKKCLLSPYFLCITDIQITTEIQLSQGNTRRESPIASKSLSIPQDFPCLLALAIGFGRKQSRRRTKEEENFHHLSWCSLFLLHFNCSDGGRIKIRISWRK